MLILEKCRGNIPYVCLCVDDEVVELLGVDLVHGALGHQRRVEPVVAAGRQQVVHHQVHTYSGTQIFSDLTF